MFFMWTHDKSIRRNQKQIDAAITMFGTEVHNFFLFTVDDDNFQSAGPLLWVYTFVLYHLSFRVWEWYNAMQ